MLGKNEKKKNLILIYYLTAVRILCLCFTAHQMIVIIMKSFVDIHESFFWMEEEVDEKLQIILR